MMPPLSEIIKEAIQKRLEDLIYFLIILAVILFCAGMVIDVICEVSAKDFNNVTEWAETAKARKNPSVFGKGGDRDQEAAPAKTLTEPVAGAAPPAF